MTQYGIIDQSKLVQVISCLVAPNHNLNQWWLIISDVQWKSHEGDFIKYTSKLDWKLIIWNFNQIFQEPMSQGKDRKYHSKVLHSWWRHQMETFSALLALCAGNSPVPGEFLAQRPVTRSFDVFFDLHPNKRLSKQWWGWWFETLLSPLWRHWNVLTLCTVNLFD